jgi:hypothetical protein
MPSPDFVIQRSNSLLMMRTSIYGPVIGLKMDFQHYLVCKLYAHKKAATIISIVTA